MNARSMLSGLATYLPGATRVRATGGTDSARYCYSVWLRHLVMARASGLDTDPRTIAELGPGDSLGIGLAGLLSGADKCFAFDVVEHASAERNLGILDELVALLRRRADIPGPEELPSTKPALEDYRFPAGILGRERLQRALDPARIERIRASLRDPRRPQSLIEYRAPWFAAERIAPASVDMIYSQAVLEHVEDLPGTYAAMMRWLRPSGFVSHQIDFKSHGTAPQWNGHWTYSEPAWRLVKGRRPYLINREPLSTHLRLLKAAGFEIRCTLAVRSSSPIGRAQLARRFRHLSDEDLATSGAFLQAVPRGGRR